MVDFKSLDPAIRCFALVGQFLQAWSLMEMSVHHTIAAALSIDDQKIAILGANLRFMAKMDILRTLVDVAPGFTDDEKTEKKKSLRDLADFSSVRNMIAHDGFAIDQAETGVEFFLVKAKGKYAEPNVVWDIEKFQNAGEQIDQYRVFLDDLTERFKSKPLSQENYTTALMPFISVDWPVPMRRTMSPALLHSLSQTEPNFLGSDQANHKKLSETPEKPQE